MSNKHKENIAEKKIFDAIENTSSSFTLTDSFFEKKAESILKKENNVNWVMESEKAILNQSPIRTRLLVYIIAATFTSLVAWSFFAPLDEISRSEGKVIPSQQLQIIQSIDGGIVEEILVQEGQKVDKDDLLIRLDSTRSTSSLRESRSQFLSLSAEISRLKALTGDSELVFDADVETEMPHVVNQEKLLYQTTKDELEEQVAVLSRQLQQREQDLREALAMKDQFSRALSLSSQELRVTRPMIKSGAVSDIDILRLEREVSQAQGEVNRAEATIARNEFAIEEANTRIREIKATAINKWRSQLNDVTARYNSLLEAESGLADKVKQTDIRSPLNGTIQRLMVNTVGGVITPGRDIVEVIPSDDRLVIEARVHPRDIAFIQTGQKAVLKFAAYDFTIYGGMPSEVLHVSADTVTDEKDNTYYLVRLSALTHLADSRIEIIPGMTVQVDIITGKKTVFDYIFKPILKATSNALTER